MNTYHSQQHHPSEKGQAAILIAVTFIVLLAFVGLAIDMGRLLVTQGQLRKSVDAASLAAASQFREGRTITEMTSMAEQVMNLNGVVPTSVLVEDCEHATVTDDPELCVTPRRKFVRVTGSMEVPMSFIRLVGWDTVTVVANAIGEAASVDVVLVIDISESMVYDASLCDGNDDDEDGVADDGRPAGKCPGGLPAIPLVGTNKDDYLYDPSVCNPLNKCQPFEKVRSAAHSFVNRVLDLPAEQESDRIAIVTFSNGWEGGTYGTQVHNPGWVNTNGAAQAIVDSLQVYTPPLCDTLAGICRKYDSGTGAYSGVDCPLFRNTTPNDPSSCTTTNIGGGMRLAGNMFATDTRPDALWVVILLTDGASNASNADATHPYGYCPDSTWDPTRPYCRDDSSFSRHSYIINPLDYDADDYARDNADFVGCYQIGTAPGCSTAGQGAVLFTIGLGAQVLAVPGSNPSDVAHGVSFLRYAAAVGDDGNPATDPCEGLYDTVDEWKTWCGNYYFDAVGDQLDQVFENIASRIFTRLHN